MEEILDRIKVLRDSPIRRKYAIRAARCPVFSHHAPPDSPAVGTIGFTSTMSAVGTRVATIGAVNAPIDWATSTSGPDTSATASTTASA